MLHAIEVLSADGRQVWEMPSHIARPERIEEPDMEAGQEEELAYLEAITEQKIAQQEALEEEKEALLSWFEEGVSDQSWYRIRHHDCFHDIGKKCSMWTNERSRGVVPKDLEETE